MFLIAVVAGLLACQALANPGDFSIYVDTSEDPINNPVAPVDAGSFTTVTGASSIDVSQCLFHFGSVAVVQLLVRISRITKCHHLTVQNHCNAAARSLVAA